MNAVLLLVEPEVIILVESRHGVMTGPSRSGTRLRFLGASIGLSTVIVLLDMAWRAEHNPCAGPTPAPQPSSTIVPWPSQKSSRTPREGRTLCSPVSLSTFCASSRRCSRARGPLRARSRARGACQLGPEHPVDIVGRRILHYAAPVCTIFNRAIFTVALAKRMLILLLLGPAVNVFVEKRR